ncbi:hypothetical protein C8R43DRAFT_16405 [Mycena crocata]|nr:hypothetical protein C8R43DRAFT_16405 [Mycena crocata]
MSLLSFIPLFPYLSPYRTAPLYYVLYVCTSPCIRVPSPHFLFPLVVSFSPVFIYSPSLHVHPRPPSSFFCLLLPPMPPCRPRSCMYGPLEFIGLLLGYLCAPLRSPPMILSYLWEPVWWLAHLLHLHVARLIAISPFPSLAVDNPSLDMDVGYLSCHLRAFALFFLVCSSPMSLFLRLYCCPDPPYPHPRLTSHRHSSACGYNYGSMLFLALPPPCSLHAHPPSSPRSHSFLWMFSHDPFRPSPDLPHC